MFFHIQSAHKRWWSKFFRRPLIILNSPSLWESSFFGLEFFQGSSWTERSCQTPTIVSLLIGFIIFLQRLMCRALGEQENWLTLVIGFANASGDERWNHFPTRSLGAGSADQGQFWRLEFPTLTLQWPVSPRLPGVRVCVPALLQNVLRLYQPIFPCCITHQHRNRRKLQRKQG